MSKFIGTSAGYGGVSLHGHTQMESGTNLDLIRDVYRYQILYQNVIMILNAYLNYFTVGDYTNLKKKLTQTTVNTLTTIINNSNIYYNDSIDNLDNFVYDVNNFDNFRNNSYYVLNGMIQALLQFDKVDQLTNDVKYYKDILKDEKSIVDYLNSHREVSQIAFSTSQVFNTTIVLKPWYKKYITDYGPPNSGIFETQKMAVVVQQLIDDGIITLEEFLTNS
jgi:hypothetical protein